CSAVHTLWKRVTRSPDEAISSPRSTSSPPGPAGARSSGGTAPPGETSMAIRRCPATRAASPSSSSRQPRYRRTACGHARQAEVSMAWMSATGSPSAGTKTKPRRVVLPRPRSAVAMGFSPWNSYRSQPSRSWSRSASWTRRTPCSLASTLIGGSSAFGRAVGRAEQREPPRGRVGLAPGCLAGSGVAPGLERAHELRHRLAPLQEVQPEDPLAGQEPAHGALAFERVPHAAPSPLPPGAAQDPRLLAEREDLGEVRERLRGRGPERGPVGRPVLRVQVLDPVLAEQALPLDHHPGPRAEVRGQRLATLLVHRRLPDELHEHDVPSRAGDPDERVRRARAA